MRNLNTKHKNKEPKIGSTRQQSFIFKNLFLIFAIIISINMKVMAQDPLSVIPYNVVALQRYQPNAICHSSFDFYWMAGQTDTLGATNSNVFLFELDPNNNMTTVRSKTFNFYKDDVAYSIHENYDQNIMVSGYETPTGSDRNGLYFLTDTTGTMLWSNAISFGSNTQVVFRSSVATPYDSGAAFAGYYKNSSGVQYACLAKTDQYGDTMWFKKYYGSPGENIAYSVCNTWDKGFLLAGNCMGSDGFRKIYIVRTDSAGTELWSKTIGDSLITTVARKILITRTYDIVIAGSLDSSALFMYLSSGGNFKYGTTFKYASANSLIATDSGYYIISGTTVPVASNPPSAWVMYLNELGDSLITYTDTTGSSSICTNFVFDVGRNGFVACGAYHQTGTVATYSAIFTLPHYIGSSWSMAGLCPVWYDRAIRLPFTGNGTAGNNYFLKSIFDWDMMASHNGTVEEDEFISWLQKNHYTKLIIDGLYWPDACGLGAAIPAILDNVNNPSCPLCERLSSFIKNARNHGVTKVYGTIHHPGAQDYASIKACKAQIDKINAFNLRANQSTYNDKGTIDGFWIDYEFWTNSNGGFCGTSLTPYPYQSVCSTYVSLNHENNPCGETYISNYTFDGLYEAQFNSNNYTEFGFTLFKELITYGETSRANVNLLWADPMGSKYCKFCVPMIKSEILLEPNFNFNVDEDGGNIPPLNYAFDSNHNPFPFVHDHTNTNYWNQNSCICPGYTFTCADASLAQSFIFAHYLMTSGEIGSLAIDFSVSDSRQHGSLDQRICGPSIDDPNDCEGFTPDHFLNCDIENAPNNTHCNGVTYEPYRLNPTNHPERQRCLDFLGSFANPNIPIWPYFSTENQILDMSNMLGNYMIADDINSPSGTDQNGYFYHYLCGLSLTHASALHFLPDIHKEFMRQYKNSWANSFVQKWPSNQPLYNGIQTLYNEISQPSEDPGIASFGLHFDHQQQGGPSTILPPIPYWGGYTGTNTHTNLVIGGMEWFAMNSFPMTLDNSGSYSTTSYGVNRVDAFDNYPTTAQPPLMQLFNTTFAANADRTFDSYNDMWVNCAAYHSERKANPDKLKVKPPLFFSADMYPSPSDGKYILNYQLLTSKGTLVILDLSNRIIFSKIIFGSINKLNVDLSYLNNGMYYWKVIDDNGSVKSGRITLLK